MKGTTMRTNLLLIAAAVAVGVGLGGSAAAADAPALGECAGVPELAHARCGTVRVPLDRGHPSFGSTAVAFALVRRRDSSRPSLGTIVANPGGPGVAVIGSSEAPYVKDLAPLLDRRDLLLVDPRGTGRSGVIACKTLGGTALAFATGEQAVARIGACGRELGARVGLYGSAAVADDIEAVRAALGLKRLDLWGDSYGTFLMPVYAARHPEHVRSVFLNGAYPVNFDPWGRNRLAGARKGIRLVCARTRACNGDAVLRDVARLATRLRSHPVSFSFAAAGHRVRIRLDEGALAELVFTAGDAAAFGRIPGAVASALRGDYASIQRLLQNRAIQNAVSLSDPSFSYAQNLATNCHDFPRVFSYADAPAARRATYARALKTIDPHAFWPFSPDGWSRTTPAGAQCLAWPNDRSARSPLSAGTRFPDVPVLVLSGDLDANTPSSAGRQAARQFPHATFVEIPNAGHTPAARNACALNLGLRFVATLQVHARACAQTGKPPQVATPALRRAAELPLVAAKGTSAERRDLGLIVVTTGDLLEQGGILEATGAADGLRGGRYVMRKDGAVRLLAVRVVHDASVSGVVSLSRAGLKGTLRLTGPGVAPGQLRVQLTETGRSHATGTLNGRRVDFSFRL
jgi:pimeloyl-ACP methyl ester carboxylesterase